MTLPATHFKSAVLLSGGLDSAILVGSLLASGHQIQPIYIRSQLFWEPAEERAARSFIAKLASPALAPFVTLDLTVSDLYSQHWSLTGLHTPHATSPDEAVFLPGRNAMLLVKSVLWCQLNGMASLALATLATSPFGDASPEFFAAFEYAMNLGGLPAIKIEAPFRNSNKQQVMEQGRNLPLELTFSCIAPVEMVHCGRCNKCAERQAAFRLAQLPDKTSYAAENTSLTSANSNSPPSS